MNIDGPEQSTWLDNVVEDEPIALCEVLDRVLNKGAAVRGDIVLSVAGIDLVYLGFDLLLCSAEKAHAIGVLHD